MLGSIAPGTVVQVAFKSKPLLFARNPLLCLRFTPYDRSLTGQQGSSYIVKVFILSQPKSGTYLCSSLLAELGLRQTYMHLSGHKFEKYDPANLEYGRKFPARYSHRVPLSESIQRLRDSEFAVGHIPYTEENRGLLAGCKKILLLRPVGEIRKSMKAFSLDTGRSLHFVPERQLQQIRDWTKEDDVYEMQFHDLVDRNLAAIDGLQTFLFGEVVRDSKECIDTVLSADSLTKSSARSERDGKNQKAVLRTVKLNVVGWLSRRGTFRMTEKIREVIWKGKLRLQRLLGISELLERIKRIEDLIFTSELKGLSYTGERQVQKSLHRIRPDHTGRYQYASTLLRPGDTVADAACGIGYGAFILATNSLADRIYAIDISQESIEYANKTWPSPNIRHLRGDIFNIEDNLGSASLDVIVSFETLEHVDDDALLLEKFFGALKPGGTLVFSTPNEAAMPYNENDFPYHKKHYHSEDIVRLMSKAGYVNIQVKSQHDRYLSLVSEDDQGLFLIIECKKPHIKLDV